MRQKSILIVDDENINHVLCEKVLESFKWIDKVYRSYNGLQALDLVKNQCKQFIAVPDIILLDLHMPLMNGIEFLKEVKSVECMGAKLDQTVIAVLSSSVNPHEINNAKAMGVRHVIPKPFSREKFVEMVVKEFI